MSGLWEEGIETIEGDNVQRRCGAHFGRGASAGVPPYIDFAGSDRENRCYEQYYTDAAA